MTEEQRQRLITGILRSSEILEGTGLTKEEKDRLPSLSDEDLKSLHHYLGYEAYLYDKRKVEEEEEEREALAALEE